MPLKMQVERIIMSIHNKTRFCPSPTGYIHLGNMRTALFSALYAHHSDGCFLLRIEDTDQARSDDVYTQALMHDMRWLGLQWDEGVDAGGDYGPYHQSKRQSVYDDYYDRLLAMKRAYPCFCAESQLALHRKLQRASGRPPRYPGTCARLSEQEIEEKIAAGLKPVLRFRMPENQSIKFTDMVRGEQCFESSDIGDFVIRRADGTASFMYCNAIDDALMGVTHVIRGEDHLTNTPRQVTILRTLELPEPEYGHIALIVGPDGSPLSKRHGSRSVGALREMGYVAGAITNYLARLGHYYGHDEYLSIDELAHQFSVSSLAKSPAKFNEEQLLYWQKQAVAKMTPVAFWDWVGPSTKSMVPEAYREHFFQVIQPNVVFPQDVARWAKVLFEPSPSMDEEQLAILDNAGDEYFALALSVVEEHGMDVKAITAHLKTSLGIKGKALFLPLRVVLTAHQHGPDLSALVAMMSLDEIKKRLGRGRSC